MRRVGGPSLFVTLLLFIEVLQTGFANGGGDEGLTVNYSNLSGIIIPGFASTQLRAWSILDCPYSPLDFNPLDLVWLDTTKVFFPILRSFVFSNYTANWDFSFFCLLGLMMWVSGLSSQFCPYYLFCHFLFLVCFLDQCV